MKVVVAMRILVTYAVLGGWKSIAPVLPVTIVVNHIVSHLVNINGEADDDSYNFVCFAFSEPNNYSRI
jgi:hypothetical protein